MANKSDRLKPACIPTTPHKLVKSMFAGDPPRKKKTARRKKSAKK